MGASPPTLTPVSHGVTPEHGHPLTPGRLENEAAGALGKKSQESASRPPTPYPPKVGLK